MADDILSIVKDLYVAFNAPSVEGVIQYFAEDCVYDDPTGGTHLGKAAVAAALAPGMSGQQTYQVTEVIASGSEAVVTWDLWIGQGEARIALAGVDLLRFRDGLISRKRCFMKAQELLIRPAPAT